MLLWPIFCENRFYHNLSHSLGVRDLDMFSFTWICYSKSTLYMQRLFFLLQDSKCNICVLHESFPLNIFKMSRLSFLLIFSQKLIHYLWILHIFFFFFWKFTYTQFLYIYIPDTQSLIISKFAFFLCIKKVHFILKK